MYSAPVSAMAISHRGLHSSVPENSFSAFRLAMAAGAEAIELDVHASRDGTVYVHHDADVVVPGGDDQPARLPIAQLDSKAISSLCLAGDHVIPTLDDVLAEVAANAGLYIEIKATGIEAAVARCLRRHPSSIDDCAVHSFDHRTVRAMIQLVPSVRTGVLQASYPIDSCEMMRAAGAQDLWQRFDFIDSALVTNVRACGGRVIAWTVNDPAEWRRLSEMGVFGICTDKVDDFVRWKRTILSQ